MDQKKCRQKRPDNPKSIKTDPVMAIRSFIPIEVAMTPCDLTGAATV